MTGHVTDSSSLNWIKALFNGSRAGENGFSFHREAEVRNTREARRCFRRGRSTQSVPSNN